MTLDPLKLVQQLVAAQSPASPLHNERLRSLTREKLSRDGESLKIYEPQPFQERFHASRVRSVIVRKGNRVGGSLMGFVEVARAVTGQDPHNKYPKENGKVVCLGYGEKHIGNVIYRMLFKPGAFKRIKDEKTKKWRSYRPWAQEDGGDLHREDEAKPADPLIPSRFLPKNAFTWEKKGDNIFNTVTLSNGWVIQAANSAGDPGQVQGFDANLYHIDEDVAAPGWVEEAIGRLAATDGFLRWTALPHAKNDEMINLIDRADMEQNSPNPSVVCIQVSIFDNKYLGAKQLQSTIDGWKALGEDVYKKRALGEIDTESTLMYPTFHKRVHEAIRFEEPRTKVQAIITSNLGEPPADWCRYLAVDPGHTVCAILAVAVPPPALSTQKVIYDEAYLYGSNATLFGDAIERMTRDRTFERFIIDMHGALASNSGTGQSALSYYLDELRKRQIKSQALGSMFCAGSDKIERREEAVRQHLALDEDGAPRVIIVGNKCPNLVREIERFRKILARVGQTNVPTDKGNRRANTHAVECMEYLLADPLPYVAPKFNVASNPIIERQRAMDRYFEGLRGQAGPASDNSSIFLGPQGVSA